MTLLFHLLESIILVISLTTDAFAASFAYGSARIRIPLLSAVVISLVCSVMLLGAMFAGGLISGFIPEGLTRWLCFIILMIIGLVRLFDNWIKGYIRNHSRISLNFKASDLKFILTIYADVECADIDCSKDLSAREAAALAIALSLDGLAVGLGAAISGTEIWLPFAISLIMTFASVVVGSILGMRLCRMLPFDLSYLSAGLLIILAILRLL